MSNNYDYIPLNPNHLSYYSTDDIRTKEGLEQLKAIKAFSLVDYEKDCWDWGTVEKPRINIDGQSLSLARLAFTAARGKIPEDMYVVSTCGTENCLNPAHLTLATASSIQRKRVIDEIVRTGERPKRIKLTMEEVIEIIADERKHKEIASDYNLSVGYVSNLKSGLYWKDVER